MIRLETLTFLKNLKENNNKDWFHANKEAYQTAKKDVENLVQQLISYISMFDGKVMHLKAKDCLFRINRDVRFSKNKAPYKSNFGASINKGGRKSSFAGYYLHIEPENSFLGGGIYSPQSAVLKKVRQEIDYNEAAFRAILAEKKFVKHFSKLQGSQLKTAPRAYSKNHPAIDLLRHKDFLALKNVPDDAFLKADFVSSAAEGFKAMHPFLNFLNQGID